jgi:hypothetical protein
MGHCHQQYSARKHPEFVVLDIGEEVGALVVHTDPGLHGIEVEISPAADDQRRSHKEILERSTSEGPAFTAVFDGLPAGDYTLWVHGDARAREVSIEGGTIVELDWRGAVVTQ